jgi:hypothetical protein
VGQYTLPFLKDALDSKGLMAVHREDHWKPEDDRRLRELVEAGRSWVLISAMLKRSIRSLQDRNRYLKRQSSKDAAFAERN